jgi:hypothetical protein
MRFELQRVHYMPAELKPGILYVSEEFDIAIHLCASGCGSKIRTPLGHAYWHFEETDSGPSLYPSIGNWQLPCQSHYWITRGEVEWAGKWSPKRIAEGRRYEGKRRQAYYEALDNKSVGNLRRLWNWIKSKFVR